jgi:hypothetical protein
VQTNQFPARSGHRRAFRSAKHRSHHRWLFTSPGRSTCWANKSRIFRSSFGNPSAWYPAKSKASGKDSP